MKYKLEEQETFIHYDPTDKKWIFETSYAPHVKNILDLAEDPDNPLMDLVKEFDEDDETSVTWVRATASNSEMFPMPASKFAKTMLPKKKRAMTEEQRERLAKQLAKGRKTQGLES